MMGAASVIMNNAKEQPRLFSCDSNRGCSFAALLTARFRRKQPHPPETGLFADSAYFGYNKCG